MKNITCVKGYLILPKLLVKHRNVFRISGKIIISCIFISPFEMLFFSENPQIKTKYVCHYCLKFSDLLPETQTFFIWSNLVLAFKKINDEYTLLDVL